MNCFPCFNRNKESGSSSRKKEQAPARMPPTEGPNSSSVQTFNFRELAMATRNFRQECLLGEGGFGRVFKGKLQASGQVVAVKQLDRNGMQGNTEFSSEVMMLSNLKHPNLVNLIGYCADGDQRLLVYEYMPLGSLEHHLFGDDHDKKPLDWITRMKIASGAAQGLEYLHDMAKPSVMYGVFKPSNVLLNEDFEPKLSDVGLSTLGTENGTNQPSSRVMDTFGYSAPEYSRGGKVTLKSDVYCFGIVLLELITGRRAIDTTRPTDEQNLVTWAQPFFRDPKRFPEMADPRLNNRFPATALNQVVGIAAMCLQDEPMVRPLINDVTSVLSCISMLPNDQPQALAPPLQQMEYEIEVQQDNHTHQDKTSEESHSSSSSDSEDCEGQSLERTHSSQGESESGSDSESDDNQSDEEESTCNSDGESPLNDTVKDIKRVSPRTSRQTVVTFREPSESSKYSASRKSDTKEESSSSSSSSSSSEDNNSESEDDQSQENQSTPNGSSSSHLQRPKQRGTSVSVAQLENGGHFDRDETDPAPLRNLDAMS